MDEKLRQIIIQELSLTGVSDNVADDVITRLGGLIMQDVIMQVTHSLSDEKVIDFEKALETYNHDNVMMFLVENVPNLDDIVVESSKKMIEAYKTI